MSLAPNPTDPRVRRTRNLLRMAFMELLHQRSLEDITVQDIAERATVNRATFYAHFEDKYALLDSLIHEQFRNALERKLTASPPSLRIGAIYALASVAFELLAEVDGHCRPTDQRVKPLFALKLQGEVQQALLDWLQRLQPTQADTLEMAATVMSWGLLGAADLWNQQGQAQSVEQAAQRAVDVLLAGVSRSLGVAPPA